MQFSEYWNKVVNGWIARPAWVRASIWFIFGLLTGGALL